MISKVHKTEIPSSSIYKQYISDIDYSDAYKMVLEDDTLSIEKFLFINLHGLRTYL